MGKITTNPRKKINVGNKKRKSGRGHRRQYFQQRSEDNKVKEKKSKITRQVLESQAQQQQQQLQQSQQLRQEVEQKNQLLQQQLQQQQEEMDALRAQLNQKDTMLGHLGETEQQVHMLHQNVSDILADNVSLRETNRRIRADRTDQMRKVQSLDRQLKAHERYIEELRLRLINNNLARAEEYLEGEGEEEEGSPSNTS